MRRFMSFAAVTITALATLMLAATAQASLLTVGEPIPPRASAAFQIIPGTYQVEQTLRPDPDGGPPWRMATFKAQLAGEELPADIEILCHVVGRYYAGQVGEVHEGGVFRPYQQGVYQSCGGADRNGQPFSTAGTLLQAVVPAVQCTPDPNPQMPDVAVCDPDNMRPVAYGLVGRAVRGWWEQGDTWKPMLVTPARGAYLAVWKGLGASARVKLRAPLCGPFARPELADNYGAVVDGCSVTLVQPPEFP